MLLRYINSMKTKHTIYMLFVLISIGCKSIENPMLRDSFTNKLDKCIHADKSYSFVTDAWFSEFVSTLDYNSIPKYSKKFDCDDFANWFFIEARKYYAFNNSGNEQSPTIGYMTYKIDSGDNHAVVFIVFKGFKVKYYDVEQRKFIELSESEVKSIYERRM